MAGNGKPVSVYRVVETCGIAAFSLVWLLLLLETVARMSAHGHLCSIVWMLPITAVTACVAADFASGLVHFLGDNFGSPSTPFLGPLLIEPFRQHHRDQRAICNHDFIESNGASALVTLPVLGAVYAASPMLVSVWGEAACLFALVFTSLVVCTNSIHRWAHAERAPRIVAWLQRRNLLLSRHHHARHHQPPHRSHYCITFGWMNPILDRCDFFHRCERSLRGLIASGATSK